MTDGTLSAESSELPAGNYWSRFWRCRSVPGAFSSIAEAVAAHFLTIFGLTMIGLVWLGVSHNLSIRHETARKAAIDNIRGLSQLFAEHVGRSIREADKRILLLRSAYERSSGSGEFDLRSWVGDELFRSDLDVQYALIGADGILIASNIGPATTRMDLSDREHFRVHVSSTSDDLFISKPVLGRASGKWSIQLTRKLTDADGRFAGVIVSSLDPYHFARLYESVDLGRGGGITLLGTDGIVRSQSGMSSDVLGRSMAKSEIFRRYKAEPAGVIKDESIIDGLPRLSSYRAVRDLPLIVITAMSEAEIFSVFEKEKRYYYFGGGCLTFIIAIFVFAGMRSRSRLDTTLAALFTERDAAQQASSAKSTFLAMMSHEIRTPMNAMLGLTSSLLEGELSTNQRAALLTVQRAGDNLLEILNDILDYSKLEAGQISLEAVPFAPKDVVEAAIAIIGARADSKGVAIKTWCDPSLPAGLVGDVGRLRQVLLNLVSNAVKFTAKGEIHIQCLCRDRSDTFAIVEWVVADTGIGMSREQISRLFKDYAQADISINRRFGGSGLGLSICKRILDRMDGSIDVSSVLGQGSTFRCRVELPVTTLASAGEGANSTAAELNAHIHRLGRPLRVLVADDNATNRLVAAKLLEEFDIQVSMAADGAEAVAQTAKTDFDVILMDMQMPEMDGIAACKAIRARGLAMPIIAFTANAYDDDRQRCRDAGMCAFVAKPVRKPLLVDAIAKSIADCSTSPAREVPSQRAKNEPPDIPLFDELVYRELADALGMEGAKQAMASYERETEQYLVELRLPGAACDREAVKRMSHTIKGAAGTFGFLRLADLARRLEREAASVDATDIQKRIALMVTAFRNGLTAAQPTFGAAEPAPALECDRSHADAHD